MGKLNDFIAYLEEQAANHSIYVWGGQGQDHATVSEAWIREKETSADNANRVISFWKKQVKAGYVEKLRAFDCSGLATYYLYNLKKLIPSDTTANGLKGKCTELARNELKKGDWVFRVYQTGKNKGKAYHVGYIVDDSLNVIEAKGRDDGVVKRSLNASGSGYWNAYGRPEIFREEIAGGDTGFVVSRLLKRAHPRMNGDDVRAVQGALIAKGYSCGSTGADGEFGSNTQKAVEAFQKATGLRADGIVGKNTVAALGGKWKAAGATWSASRILKKASPLMKGDDVKALQRALIGKGYSCGGSGADGEFGNNTESAVKRFQKSTGLAVDGKAGKNTVTKLGGVWKG